MKRLFAVLMAAVLVLTAGCGSKNTNSSNSNNGMVEQKKVDVLNLLSQHDGFDPNNFSTPEAEPAKILEEITGQKVKYFMLPAENADQKLFLEVSGGAQYHILKLTKTQYDTLSAQGALLDIKPYLDKFGPNIKSGISEEMWKTTTVNGKIYGIPEKNSYNHINFNLIVRKDILDKYNLPVPKTTDEFYEVCKTLILKGIKTPLQANLPLIHGIRGAFGIANDWTEVDGKLVYMTQHPGWQAYADYMKKLYKEGILGAEPFGTTKANDAFARFTSGQAVFLMASWWNAPALNKDMKTAGVADPEKATIWIQSLVGPNGDKGVFRDKGVSYVTAIPKSMAPYAQQVIEYVDKKFTKEVFTKYVIGDEGVNFKVENGKYIPTDKYRANARPDWYLTGAPEKLWEDYWPASIYSRLDMYNAWSRIQEHNEEFGVYDPIKMAPVLEKWGKHKEAIANAAQEELMKYVNGQIDSFDDLNKKLEAEDLNGVNEEINNWYKTFKAN